MLEKKIIVECECEDTFFDNNSGSSIGNYPPDYYRNSNHFLEKEIL